MTITKYHPEGLLLNSADNKNALKSIFTMQEAMISKKVLEARAIVCDKEHNLIVDLPCMKGIIPRSEGAIGITEGSIRDIALIAKVGKPVCFFITDIIKNPDQNNGDPIAILSRRSVQQACMDEYISTLAHGDVIPAKVTHLEQFGCFVDIGCGIPSLIPIDAISISRISHPSDRFVTGQDVRVIIKNIENGRIWLSHKELLGTWIENANMFKCGETVAGIVRSVEDYGVFVELAPNLAGLAECRENVSIGQQASVYIKALTPEKMKVKLIIVDVINAVYPNKDLKYFYNSSHIDHWLYSPENSNKIIESVFP